MRPYRTYRLPAKCFSPAARCLVALVAVLCLPIPALADDAAAVESTDARPVVGLVLGGGGARGAAHIGVLQELEKMRVPVDLIVGTSMGAIVGGLYASGMSSDDLEELVATLDWNDALGDSGSRDDMSFRRKQDDRDYPVHFELGVRDGDLQLPQGVIQGQRLDLLLRRLTINTSHIEDFDELAIPFRAVASDLISGQPYVMGQGDLALAIRASMSVPGAFAPVQVDDRLLVDGGLVGNLAIGVMQELGADIIIAVDVEFPLYSKEALGSAVGISEQVLTILIRRETLRQVELMGEQDVLIQPQLGEFASTNFAGSAEAIGPGVEAVRVQSGKLAPLALPENDYVVYRQSLQIPPPPGDTIDFVHVVRDGDGPDPLLEKRLRVRAGDSLDTEALADEASRLYGLGVFEKVGYRLVDEDGELGVEYSATTKRWGPGYLRFGLSIEDDFEGSTSFNLATRWWRPAINAFGGELRSDLQIGTDPFVRTEFYQPVLADSVFFVAPYAFLGQRNFNVFEDVALDNGGPVAELRLTEGEFGVDTGVEIGTVGEFRVGAYRGFSKARVKVGDPSIPDLDLDTGGLHAALRIDTLDDARFPRKGTQAELTWDLSRPGLGADRSYETASVDIDTAWSHGKSTLVAGLQFGSSLDTESALQDHFELGGFLRLSGLERGEVTGPYAGLARLVYYRRIGSSAGGLFELPIYVGASLEAGNAWSDSDEIGFDSLLTNGSLFLGLDSYFGPIYLAAGLAEGGRTNFYLFVGATPR